MDNLATHKNSEQVKRTRTKIIVPVLSYKEVKKEPLEAEKKLNAAFDILFEEIFKVRKASVNIEQLGV